MSHDAEKLLMLCLALGLSGLVILPISIIIRAKIISLTKEIERNKVGREITERLLLINEGEGDLDDHLATIYRLLGKHNFKLNDFGLNRFKVKVLKARFRRIRRNREDIEELIRETSSKPPGK